MNIFYVMGGGLGHLNRVSVFIRQFEVTPCKIITTHPLSEKFFRREDITQVPLSVAGDHQSLALFLASEITGTPDAALYIDTFPAGVLGELRYLKKMPNPLFYIARRLRWERYAAFTENITYHFSKTFVLEELESLHDRFIQKTSAERISIQLSYPTPIPARIPATMIPAKRPLWLIVHTSSREEVEVLHRHALDIAAIEKVEPFYVVLSDQEIKVSNGFCTTYFPASDWFEHADKIFTGAGFNILQQINGFRHKHVCIPFPRKYDDQAWRAKNSRPN